MTSPLELLPADLLERILVLASLPNDSLVGHRHYMADAIRPYQPFVTGFWKVQKEQFRWWWSTQTSLLCTSKVCVAGSVWVRVRGIPRTTRTMSQTLRCALLHALLRLADEELAKMTAIARRIMQDVVPSLPHVSAGVLRSLTDTFGGHIFETRRFLISSPTHSYEIQASWTCHSRTSATLFVDPLPCRSGPRWPRRLLCSGSEYDVVMGSTVRADILQNMTFV